MEAHTSSPSLPSLWKVVTLLFRFVSLVAVLLPFGFDSRFPLVTVSLSQAPRAGALILPFRGSRKVIHCVNNMQQGFLAEIPVV